MRNSCPERDTPLAGNDAVPKTFVLLQLIPSISCQEILKNRGKPRWFPVEVILRIAWILAVRQRDLLL